MRDVGGHQTFLLLFRFLERFDVVDGDADVLAAPVSGRAARLFGKVIQELNLSAIVPRPGAEMSRHDRQS